MSKKKRTDSHRFLSETIQLAAGQIMPPSICNLPDAALPYWHAIIASKHAEAWTPNDLLLAGTLAQITLEIQELTHSGQSRIDGDKPSAYHRIMCDLVTQKISLTRSLQIHSRATNGEAGKQAGRNRAFQDAKRIFDDEGLHELIAMPGRKQ